MLAVRKFFLPVRNIMSHGAEIFVFKVKVQAFEFARSVLISFFGRHSQIATRLSKAHLSADVVLFGRESAS